MTEFSLLLPLFMLLIFSIIQMGLLVAARVQLDHAVLEAARTAGITAFNNNSDTATCGTLRGLVNGFIAPSQISHVYIYAVDPTVNSGNDNPSLSDRGLCSATGWTGTIGWPAQVRSTTINPTSIGVHVDYVFHWTALFTGGTVTLSSSSNSQMGWYY